jgi:AraC family transcriptional regulator
VTTAPIPVTFGSIRRATLDAGGLQISSVVFPPRLRLRTHSHERACISVVPDGWGQTIPADAPHEDVFTPGMTATIVVEAEPEAAEALGAYGIWLDEVRYFRDTGIGALAVRIAREVEAPDDLTPLTVEGLVLELFAAFARCAGADQRERRPGWLERAREYVHERFAEGFSIADVAAEARVHPAHLAREFRRHYGVPIGEYARRLRLDRAAAQLAVTDESLAAVAYASGFADQSHFTRAFKRHTGVTPARYRESTRP